MIPGRRQGPLPYLERHWSAILRDLSARDREPRWYPHTSEDMAEVGRDSIDLLVTSPPYPMIARWDPLFASWSGHSLDEFRQRSDAFELAHLCLDRVWKECRRVVRPGGIAAINVGDATRTWDGRFRCFPNHGRILQSFLRLGFEPLVPILWKKPTNKPNAFLGSGFLPPNAYVTLDCEYILLFRAPGRRRHPPHDPLRYASAFSRAERDLWFSQIWTVPGSRRAGHDASFPEEIPERLVRMFSCLGDTVLDPFAGSGTTLKVATAWGRRAIGYDIGPESDPGIHPRPRDRIAVPSAESVLERIRRRYADAVGEGRGPRVTEALKARDS